MTFTTIMKDIFSRSTKEAKDNSEKGGIKRFLSKMSGGFMLPVSVMAIAGLFLGIGAAISSNTDIEGLKTFGEFIKNMGDPVFGALPLLFCAAIVISFTDNIGNAVFSAIIAFLIFSGLQGPFINVDANDASKAWILIPISDAMQERLSPLVGSSLGILSMNTSVFGGIVVGFIVQWVYKRFHEIQLPSFISFFGGTKFVPLVSIVLMIPLVFMFLLVWPWIGIGLAYFGEYSGKVAGLDSFIFGFVERALIPFGLHHVFYAPLWWTSAGGDAVTALNSFVADGGQITALGEQAFTGITGKEQLIEDLGDKTQGDSYLWIGVSSLDYNDVTFTLKDGTSKNLKLFQFFDEQLGINLGRFMQGKFSFMQFGLPAAGVAMIMAAPKENRKTAFSIIFPAALTAFVTGVTEPIEFTFVFLAPALFWGFHALMAGVSFLLMNLLGAHVGMTFSGGILDAIIYGALPFAKGTNFYWIYIIGPALAPIYYFVFYFWIKKFNLTTPGRGDNVKLFTKADFKEKQNSKNNSGGFDPKALAIIEAYGGKDNIVKTANCATRLRFDVKDSGKVSEDGLKAAGAMGVMKTSKTHVQAIVGPIADSLNVQIQKVLKN